MFYAYMLESMAVWFGLGFFGFDFFFVTASLFIS